MLHFNSYPNILEDGDLPRKLVFGDMSLNKSFSVKIADFGFAKDIVKDKEGSTILGSPMYMSPDIVVKHLDFAILKNGNHSMIMIFIYTLNLNIIISQSWTT